VLEEGELVVLEADAVAAIIEVKSILTNSELLDSLAMLTPTWLVSWLHATERSKTGLKQQVPKVPFRAVFVYSAGTATADATAGKVFKHLTEFYRTRFGDDARRVLSHQDSGLRWANLVDAVCIADRLQVEQTTLNEANEPGGFCGHPAFAAFLAKSDFGNLAVGKFCMYLLWHLTSWQGGQASRYTVHPGLFTRPVVSSQPPVRIGRK